METSKLENYGLIELSHDEAKQVEGGSFLLALLGFAIGVGIGYLIWWGCDNS